MNLLDRIIATFSPSAAVRRVAARHALAELDDVLRPKNVYEGARRDRMLEGWMTTGASANAEIGGQIDILRQRARDLGRNNAFIANGYELLAGKMVGKGIRPRLAEDVPQQVRQRTLDAWARWVDEADAAGELDLYGLQRLVARTIVESGEAVIRIEPAPGFRTPWKLRVLEPDWIDHTKNTALENGNVIHLGIEYTRGGSRVAYWMYPNHPGSDMFVNGYRGADASLRVPAESIILVYNKTRPEQTRGVPWVAASMTTARHLDDLNDALLKQAKVQACFAAFVRKTPDAASIKSEPETLRRRQQLAPAMIEYLLPDEDVTMASPPSGDIGGGDWQVMLLHAVAAGLGITYSQLTGDLREANYSSMRAGLLDFWAKLDTWQHHMLRPMMCNRMWQVFEGVESIRQRRTFPLLADWDFPERPFVDPQKDGEALDAALLAGRKTFHQVIASSGVDPEVHIAELRREREELADLDLPFITKPAAPAPAQQPAVAEQQPANGADNGQRVLQ